MTFLYFLAPPRLQEVNSMINKRLKDVLFSDQWSELCMDTLSPFGYVLVSRTSNMLVTLSFSHTLFCIVNTQHINLLFFVHPHVFRWRPSECRECCCWFSLNSATFPSSEACRQRARAQGSGDIGYVIRIEGRCSESCSEIYHVRGERKKN